VGGFLYICIVMETIQTKCCSKCGIKKPTTIEFFVINKKVKSGIGSICRKCANSYNSKKQTEKRDEIRNKKFSSPEKQCRICNSLFPRTIEYFTKRLSSLDGLRNECRHCLNKYKNSIRDYESEKIRAKEYRILLRQTNPVKFNQNAERQSKKVKEYRTLGYYPNGETVKQVRKRNGITRYKKIKSSEIDLMKHTIRGLILNSIKKQGWSKKTKTHLILGCSYDEFKIYIESKFQEGMNWFNHGIDGWHYDHIIPISSAQNEEEVYKLNHYTNFQPLWWYDNLKKSDKISEEWGNV